MATLQVYAKCLLGTRIRTWLEDQGIRSVVQLDTAALRRYELFLMDARQPNGEPLSPPTRHQAHRVLHTFAAYAQAEGWELDEGVLSVKGPKLPQREPPTLSEADERTVLAACRCERDRYLIEFMVRTGVRLSGACSVTLDDLIDGPDGLMLRVTEKPDKQRIIPLDTQGYRGSKRLRTYIDRVRPADTRRRELFLTLRRHGPRGDYTALTPHAVQTIMKRLSLGTGVKLHPHLLRHTMASRAIAAGVDPLTLQRVLGHTTLTMVSRYVHYDHSSLSRIWSRRTD